TYLVQLPGPGLGQTVLTSGLMFLPGVIVMMILGPLVGRWVTTWGPKPIMIIGFLSIAVGGLVLVFYNTTILDLILAPIPVLAGAVAVLIAMTNVILLASAPREVGIQIGMNQTFRNLGSSLGPIIAATILASFTGVFLITVAPSVVAPVTLPTLTAFRWVYGVTAVLGLVGAGLSSSIRNFRFTKEGSRVDAPRAQDPRTTRETSKIAVDTRSRLEGPPDRTP
ncbi:MAG: MFS transporter, partial [Thermoplasmata archaeon]